MRWYPRYDLSYRDVEELLAERGVHVDHLTIHRWVQRFAPLLAAVAIALGTRSGRGGRSTRLPVKVGGGWRYVYRAMDEYGQMIDVYVSPCVASHRAVANDRIEADHAQ